MRQRLFGGRIRTSTLILALLFIVTLVAYILVRPVPAAVTDTRRPATTRASTTPSAPSRPTPSPTATPAEPARTAAPTATGNGPGGTPATPPSPPNTTTGVASPTP
jgi:hypothetical protein